MAEIGTIFSLRRTILGTAAALFLAGNVAAEPVTVRVTIENLSPVNGVLTTPLWVGFHDGSFDTYDPGAPAETFLERLAEDGNTTPITDEFTDSGAGTQQGTIGSPLAPGAPPVSMLFTLDSDDPTSRFFSYAAMVIPSNDAFVANGNPEAFEIFDSNGNFQGANFFITGAQVNDAGTEVNDEIPGNTAALAQAAPDTGVDENGVVTLHPGFLDPSIGNILSNPAFANADFSLDGFPIAQIQVQAVPLPPAVLLLASAVGGLVFTRRRART